MTVPQQPPYAEMGPPPQVPENPGGEMVDPDHDFVDYFAFSEEKIFPLPDGKQHLVFKILTEGDRARFQKATNKPVRMSRDGEAEFRADPAEERKALILVSVVGWNLKRRLNGRVQDIPFSAGTPGSNLEQWLEKADPRIVMDLEDAIRQANPWLLNEASVEDIDKQIEQLKKDRERALEREARSAAFQASSS